MVLRALEPFDDGVKWSERHVLSIYPTLWVVHALSQPKE